MLLDFVGSMNTVALEIKANQVTPLASIEARGKKRTGRIAIEIANTSNAKIYIGGSDLTVNNGLPLASGERKIIPINYLAVNGLFVTASADTSIILAEYYS